MDALSSSTSVLAIQNTPNGAGQCGHRDRFSNYGIGLFGDLIVGGVAGKKDDFGQGGQSPHLL